MRSTRRPAPTPRRSRRQLARTPDPIGMRPRPRECRRRSRPRESRRASPSPCHRRTARAPCPHPPLPPSRPPRASDRATSAPSRCDRRQQRSAVGRTWESAAAADRWQWLHRGSRRLARPGSR
ncbi:MAG: hypothetical protein F4102_04805 [Chloroflexi bacterium]|nr:hypothetical protein [Chloroflexota bacterium]